MSAPPRVRQLMLTLHVVTSVGFLGTVAAFFALAVVGLTSKDVQTVSAAYLAMAMITWFVIIPLCIASLLSGIVQALGTTWGLFRHYWVLVKLFLILTSTGVLWIHLQPISFMARVAAEMPLSDADVRGLRVQLIIASGAALVVLFTTTALSVYKPRGVTRYGWRKQQEQSHRHR